MEQSTKEKLKDTNAWLRLLFALLFAIVVFYLVKLLVTLILIVQFCSVLFTARPIDRLRVFSGQLSLYSFQLLEYVGYNQEDKPFPFNDWPAGTQQDTPSASKKSTKKKSRRSVAKKVPAKSAAAAEDSPEQSEDSSKGPAGAKE